MSEHRSKRPSARAPSVAPSPSSAPPREPAPERAATPPVASERVGARRPSPRAPVAATPDSDPAPDAADAKLPTEAKPPAKAKAKRKSTKKRAAAPRKKRAAKKTKKAPGDNPSATRSRPAKTRAKAPAAGVSAPEPAVEPQAPAAATSEPEAPAAGATPPRAASDASADAPVSGATSTARERLYELHRDLDALIEQVESGVDDPAAQRRAAEAMGYLASRLGPEPEEGAEDLFATARQLLSTDYYLRQWGRLGMRNRSEHVDDFGLDPTYEERVQPLLDLFFERYFRVQVSGAEHIPETGPALLVCNHAGSLPWDGVMLKTALKRELPADRPLRWLTEDFAFHAPFLGAFINRIGAVRACQENAQRLLSQGQLLAVFPEGIKGIEKLYRERYRLQRFGRGGHVKLALREGVPVIPAAIVGAEEAYPLLYRVRAFSKAVGLPFIPVTPTFPLLGPLGAMPLPSRWVIRIGQPVQGLDDHGPEAADDPSIVNELNETIRRAVDGLLSEALEQRGERAYL